jgi:protein-S-isoprenylcysteine O-methyltransferase Ste14
MERVMTSKTGTAVSGAKVAPVPPPIYYVAGLVVGAVLQQVMAAPLGGRPATGVAGAVMVVAGLILMAGGVAGIVRHRTTIVPHHAVSVLVRDGAYRLSRNPMYTGLAVAYLGVALLLGSWWPVVLWPVVVLAVHRLVIRPEEQHLTARFGQEYADYCHRVRRWL